MAYASKEDVAGEFKSISYSSTTNPKDSQVDEFITQADAFINAKISNKYVTPVTGADSLSILKNISVWFVADRIKDILKVKNVSDEVDQGVREGSLYKRAMDMLDEIAKGDLILPDATLATSKIGPRSYANDNNLEYTFKKGVNQW